MDEQGGQGWNTGPQQPPGWGDQRWGDQPPQQLPPGWGDQPAQAPGRLRPLTLADVLDGMFRLLVSHWRVYLLTLGVIVIPYQVLGNWVSAEAMDLGAFVNVFQDPLAPVPPGDERFGAASQILGLIAFLVINPLTYGLATRLAADIFEGRSPTFGGTWRATGRRYLALLGFTLLSALMLFAAMILPGVFFAAAAAAQSGGMLIITVLLFFAAALFMATKLSHGYAAIMVEGAGPGTAVGRSWQLTRGRFWRVAGTIVLCIILVVVVTLIFTAIFTLPGVALGPGAAIVLLIIGAVIAAIITTPLIWNAITLLYFDGRIRYEGYDLEVMTRNVVGSDPGTPPPPPGYGQPFG